MPDYGMLIIGDAHGEHRGLSGCWLAEYDPDYAEGAGHVRATKDPAEAMRFKSQSEALELWRKQSAVAPLRLDGKPNRPLSAWSVEISLLPDG